MPSGHYVGKSCECQFDFPDINDVTKLRVTLKRPGSNTEEPLTVQDGPGHAIIVSFVPESPGDHQLSMNISGRHVSGSPFNIPVEEAPGQTSTGSPLSLALELMGVNLPADFQQLTAKLRRPDQQKLEDSGLELELLPDNTVALTFVPYVSGKYLVHIYKMGKEVSGSPFSVQAKGPTPPDPSKVRVIGDGIKRGISGQTNKFTIDARDAGDGGLGFSVEGPSKAEINCISKDDGTCEVEFLPKMPGVYIIHIKYADQHIPGSPFTCLVAGADGKLPAEPPPKKTTTAPANISRREFTVESSIMAPRNRAPSAQRPHGLEVDLTGYDISQLSANVETPTGQVENAKIVLTSRDKYTVTFVTRNGGTHKVNVRHNRKHIPGSPFLVDVDTAHWQLTTKCKVSGPKNQTGAVAKPCVYVLSTKESGGGNLGVTVEGPTSSDIECQPIGKDEYKITFVPMATGTYVMHMRFAGQDIFKSVVLVPTGAEERPDGTEHQPSESPTAVQLTSTELKVGERFTLQIPFTGTADQLVTAYVVGPGDSKIPAIVTKDGEDMCAVSFTPEEPGEHTIQVLIMGVRINPYKLTVGAHKVDPTKVRVHGPGLKNATAGKETSFTVDALDAGPGTLSIDAAGPDKLEVRCEQTNVGSYRVSYTPKVNGKYEVSITFGGENVPNSPFHIEVGPDPSSSNADLCTSGGTGLYGGIPGKPSPFTVNCSKAGRGSLLVGVEGPTIPVNEINIRHDGNSVFLVDYSLEEPGNYILKVLWDEEHIQGSPFPVRVERKNGGGIYVGR